MEQQNDYQFIMMPQQLASCLDANCGKMLTVLLGLSSLMKNEDGWFFRSNKDLQLDTRMSENLVRATLDTLYRAGIINIDCVGGGRGHRANRIHINFESFKRYEQYSFNDIRNNPDLWIETVPYKNHYSPSYCKDKGKEIGNTLGKRIGKKVSTNTDTTDTSNTIEYNIYNKKEAEEDSIFFIDFLSNPTRDYSDLLKDMPSFARRYTTELNVLNHKLTEFHHEEPSARYILDNLQYYYVKKSLT